MKQKLLKIMNILRQFSLEDLATYMECKLNEIIPYIKQFEVDNIINKTSDNHYLYNKPILNARLSKNSIKKSTQEAGNAKTRKKRKITNVLFEDAVKEYLCYLVSKKIKIYKSKKYSLKKLEKYFHGFRLEKINKEEIIKFKKYLLTTGFGLETVTGLIGVLLAILKMYGYKYDRKIFENSKNSCIVFTNDDIKNLVLQCGPEAWTIILGLKVSEIAALQYEDIDFRKGTVTINKTYHDKTIYKINFKYAKILKLHPILLNSIDKKKKGPIFGEIEMPLYESCICAHFNLLQQQNIPLELIAKEMRYKTYKTFYVRFKDFFPKEISPDFDILKPLNIENYKLTERSI